MDYLWFQISIVFCIKFRRSYRSAKLREDGVLARVPKSKSLSLANPPGKAVPKKEDNSFRLL